ncbi:MAG: glycosyltransferase [Smithellaceae bacterium]|nr:glycosyltransferase [Smithellaceae bacterium]
MIPDISYLILNYNPEGEKTAADCLAATIDAFYQRKSKKLTCDVVLLDQGSVSGHRGWLQEKQGQYDFSLVLLNRNLGISGAINWFVRTCKSPVIGLITSDVLITSGMDEDLFEKAQIQENFQITPFTDKSDLDYQTWTPSEPFGAEHVNLESLRRGKKSLLDSVLGRKGRAYVRVIGSELNVMFWRREIFDKVGYFDERWKACYENNDFSLRCFLAGGCTAVSMDSFVWHYHKMTEKNQARDKCYDGYIDKNWSEKNRRLWDEKWPDVESYIKIYDPLKSKTIADYPKLLKKFTHNIHLPYEQDKDYY